MKINPQSILPSLNTKKQKRLTLNKKENISQIPHNLFNPNLREIIQQRKRKSQSLQQKRLSHSNTPKSNTLAFQLINKVQQQTKTLQKVNKTQSQSQFHSKKSSFIENQGKDFKQEKNLIIQKEKSPNLQIINFQRQNSIYQQEQVKLNNNKESRVNLRPCHRKLLKNLLIKENPQQQQQNSDLSIFLDTNKNSTVEDQSMGNNKNQRESMKSGISFFDILKKKEDTNELMKMVGRQSKCLNDKFNNFIQQKRDNQLKKQQKQQNNVGTMTQLTINNDSYNEFMKFKLSQQDAYLKMKQLFTFVSDVAALQSLKFQQRHKDLHQVYKQTVASQRQTRIIQLINKIQTIQNQFSNDFIAYCQKLQKIQEKLNYNSQNQIILVRNQLFKIKQILKNSNLLINTSSYQSGSLFQNKQNLFNNMTSNQIKTQIDNKLTKIQNTFIQFHLKQSQKRQKIANQIFKGRADLLKKFQIWQSSNDQKKFMTKVCINDVIRLPQISMVVFGLSKSTYTTQQIQVMKKIGINLDEVSQFQQFYESQKVSKGIDKAFNQLRNVKCLNCAYFKSKMRIIQKTNCQLEPVLKILNHLMRDQNKKNYDFK